MRPPCSGASGLSPRFGRHPRRDARGARRARSPLRRRARRLTGPIEHGSLYAADLSPRRGTGAGKVQPVLVIQTDLLNAAGHPSTWVLPCTARLSGDNLLRVSLLKGIAGNAADCEIMIDQSRSMDNRRLRRRLGRLPRGLLAEVKQKLRLLGDL